MSSGRVRAAAAAAAAEQPQQHLRTSAEHKRARELKDDRDAHGLLQRQRFASDACAYARESEHSPTPPGRCGGVRRARVRAQPPPPRIDAFSRAAPKALATSLEPEEDGRREGQPAMRVDLFLWRSADLPPDGREDRPARCKCARVLTCSESEDEGGNRAHLQADVSWCGLASNVA